MLGGLPSTIMTSNNVEDDLEPLYTVMLNSYVSLIAIKAVVKVRFAEFVSEGRNNKHYAL